MYKIFIRLYFAPEKNNMSHHLKRIPLKNFERLLEFKRIFNNTTVAQQPQNSKETPLKDIGVEFENQEGTGEREIIIEGSRRVSDQPPDSSGFGNNPSDFLKFSDQYSKSRHSFSKWLKEGAGKMLSNRGLAASKGSGSRKEGINSFSFEDNLNKFHETSSLLEFDNNLKDDDSLKGNKNLFSNFFHFFKFLNFAIL